MILSSPPPQFGQRCMWMSKQSSACNWFKALVAALRADTNTWTAMRARRYGTAFAGLSQFKPDRRMQAIHAPVGARGYRRRLRRSCLIQLSLPRSSC